MSDGPYGPPSPGEPQPPSYPQQPQPPQTPPFQQPPQAPQQPPTPPYGQPPAYGQPPYGPPPVPPVPPSGPPYPGGVPSGSPYPGIPGVPPPKKSSNKGLWIGLGIAALVLLLLCCGGGIALVVASVNAAQDEIDRAIPSPEFPTPADTATDDPTAADPEPGDKTGSVGTPVRMTDLEFTIVSKPSCAAGDLGTGANKASPLRGQFCKVPIKLENKGTDSNSWDCIRLTMVTAQNPKAYYSSSGNRALTGENRCNAQIAPGATWTATMVFDIETGDTPRSIVFTEDYQGNATVPL